MIKIPAPAKETRSRPLESCADCPAQRGALVHCLDMFTTLAVVYTSPNRPIATSPSSSQKDRPPLFSTPPRPHHY